MATIPILMYHDIADGPSHEKFRRWVVPPSLLDEHLAALKSAGYDTATASGLAQRVAVGAEGKPIAYLTFDDGYQSFERVAMPLLARYGMTGTVFVPTAYVGRTAGWLSDMNEDHRRLMSWSDLADVRQAGAEVGGHGHYHLPFDLIGRRQLIAEIRDGRTMLEDRLGSAVSMLAYPYGFHTRAVRNLARASGYRCAFEVGDNLQSGLGPAPRTDKLYRLRRIVVDPDLSADALLRLMREGRRSAAVQRARCMVRPGFRAVRRLTRAQLHDRR